MALVFHFFIFLFYGSTAPYPSPCCTVPTVLELLPNRSHFLLGIDCGEYPVSKLINRSSGTTDGHLSFILFIPSILSSPAPSLPPSSSPSKYSDTPWRTQFIHRHLIKPYSNLASPFSLTLPLSFSLPPTTSAALYSTQHFSPLRHISTEPPGTPTITVILILPSRNTRLRKLPYESILVTLAVPLRSCLRWVVLARR